MPRTSVAHQREFRNRILAAAFRVFAEKGFHRATMQDVASATGLSVGALYTYFDGKVELFLASCDLSTGEGIGELGSRLAIGGTLSDRIAIAIGYFLDGVDDVDGEPGPTRFLIQAWAEADKEPLVREMLIRRREQFATVGQILIREGIAAGALPAWVDVEGLAFALSALFDGILLMRVEDASGYRRADAERRIRAMIELILAADGTAAPPVLPVAGPMPVLAGRNAVAAGTRDRA